ncbi:hypothetical protein V1519DRAFT_440873 [Lipomyces tetrasporus]
MRSIHSARRDAQRLLQRSWRGPDEYDPEASIVLRPVHSFFCSMTSVRSCVETRYTLAVRRPICRMYISLSKPTWIGIIVGNLGLPRGLTCLRLGLLLFCGRDAWLLSRVVRSLTLAVLDHLWLLYLQRRVAAVVRRDRRAIWFTDRVARYQIPTTATSSVDGMRLCFA